MKTLADYHYTVRVDRIVSAFCNPVDDALVTQYMERMLAGEKPPRICGYPSIIDEDDIGQQFLSGEEIQPQHIGLNIWYVTNGHHRTCAALEAGITYLDAKIDPFTLTNYDDLAEYRTVMSTQYQRTIDNSSHF